MPEAIIITPVKDSPDTTEKTIQAIHKAEGDFSYYVFDDFSNETTRKILVDLNKQYSFTLVHLDEITSSPSPNYNLVLQKSQELALKHKVPLIIIESDVIIKEDTITNLLSALKTKDKPGLIGAITVDESSNYNFPYTFEKYKSSEVKETSHSLSFCCTLLSPEFLKQFSFNELSNEKDWYDVFISRQSRKLGFVNYLAKDSEVLHLPHSSRPWKNLKYTNPLLYYYRKYINKRDRI